jgi:hypothetical protein
MTTPLRRLHTGHLLDNWMDTVLHACGVMGTLLLIPTLIVGLSAVVTGKDITGTQKTTVEFRK